MTAGGARTFVIAEAAATHDGSLAKALRLVDLAREIGADAIKFQWCSSPERLAARRRAPEYLDAYRLLAFPREWFPTLVARCSAPRDASPLSTDPPGIVHAVPPIEFMCTVYLPEDIAVVASYVTRFKAASFEAQDSSFVSLHGCWPQVPLIISAGMNADLRESLRRYLLVGGKTPASVLACTSAYPCPSEELALWRLRRDPERVCWYDYDGLSDHSRHPWTGALAVAAGARIIEFHIRLADTNPENADFSVARDPQEALEYVRHIREAEAMMGDGSARVQPSETPMLRYRVTGEPA